jgi:hypothetical protein
LIPIDTDADCASRILARIQQRCPELTAADLLLVARVLADHRRAEDGLASSELEEPRAKDRPRGS